MRYGVKFTKTSLLVIVAILAVLGGCISTKDIKDAKVHYTLGLSYMREPNYSLALKELLMAEKMNPRDANIHLALGQTYQMMKAYPDAEKSYKQALKLSSNTEEALCQNNLGALYLDMERWDLAISYFGQAAGNLLFQTPEVAHAGIGVAYYKKGDYLTAVPSFKKALEINPRYAPALLRLAETYEALGRSDLAMNEYLELTRLAPENATIQYRLGIAAAKAGKKTQAIKAFREVIRIAPTSEEGKLAVNNINLLQ